MDRQTILLVEDDEGTRYATEEHLDRAGYRVISVPDTMEALAAADAGLSPDCLLADIRMPAGIPHGIALAKMLRMKIPELAVLLVTGDRDAADIARTSITSSETLIKPVAPDEIIGTIRRLLEARHG